MKKLVLAIFIALNTFVEVSAQTGAPVETNPKVAPDQVPAFPGQTRIGGVVTQTPYKSTIVTSSLSFPWDMVFLPDGRMMVTEKPGRIRIVTKEGTVGPALTGVPPVAYKSDSGLLGLILDPDFATTRLVFWTSVEPLPEGNLTSVVRARLSLNETGFENVTVIYRGTPAYAGFQHPGTRMVFDKQGRLYVALGEHYDDAPRMQAQEVNSSLGKIIRINKDGSPAAGNPFENTPGARPEIWSLGHRDPQGLAFHPVTGDLWEAEHGPMAGDEVNIIRPGTNYGWPIIAYGLEYTGPRKGQTVGNGTQQAGMAQPQYYWDPVVAPSGITFYTGSSMPEWKNNLFLAVLRAKHIIRLVIDGNNKIVGEERLLVDQGQRFRTVVQGPDGALYALTDQATGRIYLIEAKSKNTTLSTFKLSPSSTLEKGTATSSVVNYGYSVPAATASVRISAVLPAGATMTINNKSTPSGVFSDEIPLTSYSTTIDIKVTAEDGITQKTYLVAVRRAGAANANLNSLSLSNATLSPAFSTSTKSYSANVANAVTSVTVIPTVANSEATVRVNGMPTGSRSASAPITLSTGANVITVEVTAGSGAVNNYVINVDRAKSAEVNLSTFKLKPSSKIVKGPSSPELAEFSYNVPSATLKVNISAVTPNGAIMTINGTPTPSDVFSQDIPLTGNATAINIVVTAENGVTKRNYIVTINRPSPMRTASTMKTTAIVGQDPIKSEGNADPVVHQAISPNGDDLNDRLIIDGIAAFPKNTLKIMDQSGSVIFQAKGYDNAERSFAGRSDAGVLLPGGTYYYFLQYEDGKLVKTKTGYLVLKYDSRQTN